MGLYIIVGASGAGKNFIFKKLQSLMPNAIEIKKMTTKPKPISGVKNDLIYDVSYKEISSECEFIYSSKEGKEEYFYGIKECDIIQAMSENLNPILIVRDYKVLIGLKRIFPQAITIKMTTGVAEKDLKEALQKSNNTDNLTVYQRIEKEKKEYLDSIQYSGDISFDGYIENNFDYTINPQIQKILFDVSDIKFFNVFVACQFYDSIENNYKYSRIKNAIKDIGESLNKSLEKRFVVLGKDYKGQKVNIKLVNENDKDNAGSYIITERIKKEIRESYFVICDLSVDNANVFYEYEYALQIKKQNVITIASKDSYGTKVADIDIIYKDFNELVIKLGENLEKKYMLS